MSLETPRPVRPGRVRRRTFSRRRRTVVIVGLLAAVFLIGVALNTVGEGPGEATPTPSSTPITSGGPERLLALSVTGAPHALLAVIGVGGDLPSAALILPSGVTVTSPGQGEATTDAVQALSGDSMRVSVANAVGTWVGSYAVMDLHGLEQVIDAMGGLSVILPQAYDVGSEVLGPGKTEMDGSQVVTLLYEQSPDPTARWRAVLKALLVAPPELQASDLLDTDDAGTAAAIVSAAAGAQPTVPPTQTLAGAVTVFPQPRFDTLVTRIFGTEPPDPVQVENGNGEPGVGEQVAALVIPAGFRVVLSGNAQDFNHPTTDVTANGIETQDEAQRVVDALGVGTVTVSQVPSGIADVTIVVGKDFSG